MISIQKVITKQDYKDFVKFPFKLYKNSKYWVSPIVAEELEMMNKENIDTYHVMDENWKNYLFNTLVDFNKQTKSKRAAFIIENFDQEITKFVHVVPDEVIDKLSFPVKENHKIA